MDLLTPTPILFNMVMIPVAMLLVHIVITRILKINRSFIAYKTSFFVCLALISVVELAMIVFAVFNGEVIVLLISYPIGTLFTSLIYFYTIKIVHKKDTSLQNILEKSSNASINVANMATELAASASEVTSAAEQIASTTVDVSDRSRIQASSLRDINSMTHDIGRITKIIKKLAAKTNMLALNASIEAGRAEQYGKGFAVVAEEVRKLAEESQNSVEKTSVIVGTIIKKIEESSKNSNEISAAMEEISSATEEQTASMEEISGTSNNVGDLAEDLKKELLKHSDNSKEAKFNGNLISPEQFVVRRFGKYQITKIK